MEIAQTADYAVSVLLTLESHGPQTIAEIATRLDLSRSVAQRIVVTLHRRALVMRGQDGRYDLGAALIKLAAELPHELAVTARPMVRALAESSGETVVVAVAEGDEAVVVARHTGNAGPLRIEYQIGFRHSLGRGASGLAILAYLSPQRRQKLGLVVDDSVLDQVAVKGFAKTESELQDHMVGLAAPIVDGEGGVIASLAIVAPAGRAENLERFVPALMATSQRISDARSVERASVATASRRESVPG
ncbi:MAG TPA: helix-turn-helix domain-containing protein [Pseudolysinimonas sp.]|nr:helix-turn-helix domain-containing protein [Pseudolysinimonas sp.]